MGQSNEQSGVSATRPNNREAQCYHVSTVLASTEPRIRKYVGKGEGRQGTVLRQVCLTKRTYAPSSHLPGLGVREHRGGRDEGRARKLLTRARPSVATWGEGPKHVAPACLSETSSAPGPAEQVQLQEGITPSSKLRTNRILPRHVVPGAFICGLVSKPSDCLGCLPETISSTNSWLNCNKETPEA